jgi:hypothetical protein
LEIAIGNDAKEYGYYIDNKLGPNQKKYVFVKY